MVCPSDDTSFRLYQANGQDYYPYSYVMNSYLSYGTNSSPYVPGTLTAPKNNLTFKNDYAWKISQVKRSSDKIMVYEEDERSLIDGRGQLQSPGIGSNVANVVGMLAIRHDSKRINPDPVVSSNLAAPFNDVKSSVYPNRDRKGNVGFVDGHGEYVARSYASSQAHFDPKF